MAEHVPKRERVMRASLKEAGESVSDYLQQRASGGAPHPDDGQEAPAAGSAAGGASAAGTSRDTD